MTEQQRLTDDNARLTGEVQRLTADARSRAVREAVSEVAPRLGISDPKLAARLLDVKEDDFDSDGNVKNLDKKLEDLKREYPGIAVRARGSADAGAGRDSSPNDTDINARIRERLGR